jgi:hypothetical protein
VTVASTPARAREHGLIAVSARLTKPLALGCHHNATSVRASQKRQSVARCIPRSVTALRPQLRSSGTRRVGLTALHRPATSSIPTRGQVLSRQPPAQHARRCRSRNGAASRADATPPKMPRESSHLTAHGLDADTLADVNCPLPLALLMASSSRSERRRSRYLPLKSRSSNRTDRHPRGGDLVEIVRRDHDCDLPALLRRALPEARRSQS